jgi:hypothetical protein
MMLEVDDERAEEVMSDLRRAGIWLADELREPAVERGCLTTDLEPSILQTVLIRRVPELLAMTTKTLLKAPPRDWDLLVEHFVYHHMSHLPALTSLEQDLEHLWIDYLPQVQLWVGWESVDDLEELMPDFKVQCFRRPSDGKYAADFVSLLPWSHDREDPPEPLDRAVEQDGDAVHQVLEDYFGADFLGLRCVTPSMDGIDVLWKPGWLTSEDELPVLDRQHA